ncbi:MAG TPA: pseudouridine synthase [Solirubrobacteraceae bacterium]
MRLAKFLASAGVASRRASEELIRAGRVAVGGAVATDPARDVDVESNVTVDGQAVRQPPQRLVYAVNKPAGVVSTARDPQGRATIVSLVPNPPGGARLYPVGRLDIDTTGLILLTNDGELAHRLTHPRFEVPKTYRALVAHPPVTTRAIRALRDGVTLEDGRTAPAAVRLLATDRLEIVISEGRKRQVKRMLEHVGHPVRQLERVAFGPLQLGGLRPGSHRMLADGEVQQLLSAGSADRRT